LEASLSASVLGIDGQNTLEISDALFSIFCQGRKPQQRLLVVGVLLHHGLEERIGTGAIALARCLHPLL